MPFFPLRSYRPAPEQDALKKLGEASTASFGPSLRLISWNIFKAQRRGWLADLTTLATGADLVLLQEAVLHGGVAHPFHLASGLEWIMVENLKSRREHVTTGPKTGCRVAAAAMTFVRSQDFEPISRTPKTFLHTEYPLASHGKESARLLVLNVHAINLVSHTKFARQVQQITAAVSAHTGPCIIAGDFNTWNEPRWHLLQKAMMDAGLTRAPVAAPQWRHFNQTLDHVFYRGVRLIGARALTHVRSSDHIPLAADFDLTCAS
ncbi:MAG: endonuclease/exonuclease/phosphatase family protein [Rhodospirillaceae bacterium]|nr:endonuclease/exonuclease/phosphatase family protein [Rhodospirillaceae bacterium]